MNLEYREMCEKFYKFKSATFEGNFFYKNIAIIVIQHSKIYFVNTFGDFSHTVE